MSEYNRPRFPSRSSKRPSIHGACFEALEARRLLAVLTIAQENLLPGAPKSQWDVNGVGDLAIQGYATDISVDQGQTVSFKIDDTTQAPYHLDIYRMGYYGGMGARQVATINSAQTLRVAQPTPLTDATTGLVDAGNWSVTASWAVPGDATSGIYFAKVVREDTGGASHIVFVVRDDDGRSDLLFQTSDSTWQAYNSYGGNSLYTGNSAFGARAVKVSYNRPFNTRVTSNRSWLFATEYPMVRFLEANGYNVSYTTDLDSDRRGGELLEHKAFLSVGHDEYWSGGQRTSVEAARAAGINLAFFSGNEVFWKTRWEGSIDGSGTPYRTLVSYKETRNNAKIDPSPEWTGSWRDPRFSPPSNGGRPENALTGTLYTVDEGADPVGTSITVPSTSSGLRFWRNTSVATLSGAQSATLGNSVLGYEWNEDLDNGFRPAGLINLSSTTQNVVAKLQDYGTTTAPGTATHSLTLYRAPSGALVFSAGTVQWSWGLDAAHDGRVTTPDVNLQQATVNLLADMRVQPATLISGLVPASASTDVTKPTSIITSPAAGATVHTARQITIAGTASDAGGGVVAGVEISVDGGLTWRKATGRSTWSYTWTPNREGTATILSRAVDDNGNIETPGAGRTVNVTGPISIWSSTAVPGTITDSDTDAIELGLKFRSDIDGFITGIRFYKGPLNTGTHVGHLWTTGGTLLATATFGAETASGWQQVDLSSPVAVAANTTYVVSYYTPVGRYSSSGGYFSSTGANNGTLRAPASGASGGNGVYRYGTGGGFPNQTFNATNYWVDVVFDTDVVDTTPPGVTTVSPGANGTNVATGAAVTATFSEDVDPATVNASTFQLTGPGGAAVAATVSYNATTRTAVLTPSSPLGNSTLYTVVLKGGTSGPRITDAAGNALAAPYTWSFATAQALGSGPFSLWSGTTVPSVASENDTDPVELGVKFRSDVDGFVTGIRFYKGPLNTGTHVGHLWTTGGTLLATATFGAETASGWQQVDLSSPVAVAANTTYVVSYYTPVGRYASSGGYFASQTTTGPLTAPASGASGGNGVYRYGAGGGFPAQTFNSTNYWVDVVLRSTVADTTPPAVAGRSPAPSATAVSPDSAVSVTFDERIQSATLAFVLRNPAGNVVPSTVTYDDATRTATLRPASALAPSTTYAATVSGAKDLAGNAMTSTVTWSFTTGVLTQTWSQTAAVDFGAGTNGGTAVTSTAGGEVQLAPQTTFTDDFNGTALGATWATTSWAPAGGGPSNVAVSGGTLTVAGSNVATTASVPPGSSTEGRVSFGTGRFQHFGIATSLADVAGQYWAIFGTAGTSDTLFARLNVNGATQDVSLGALPGGFHLYRVQPVGGGFEFYVDGILRTTLSGAFPSGAPVKVAASAFFGSPPLVVDSVRISAYPATGTFTSSVFDAGRVATWLRATWNATVPAGTTLVVETSSGGTATPDGTWSPWAVVTANGTIASPAARYVQYRVRFTTADGVQSAVLNDIAVVWS